MRLIFSYNRAAQLDLLLQSLERNAEAEPTYVLWRASSDQFRAGYERVKADHEVCLIGDESSVIGAELFNLHTHQLFDFIDAEYVTFLCDDDVLYRYIRDEPWREYPFLGNSENVICFSWRLGENATLCYPSAHLQRVPEEVISASWDWRLAEGDFAYPGSLDGHTFRTADVQRMLAGKTFRNPTELEDALQAGCLALADERPLMACYPRSVLVSVPVNRVSEQSTVRHGANPAYSATALNARYLAGERLDLDAVIAQAGAVDAAHCELELSWRPA